MKATNDDNLYALPNKVTSDELQSTLFEKSKNVIFTRGEISTPIKDPLVVHLNGSDYYLGRKEAGYYLLIWPYQAPEMTKGGLIIPTQSREADPYQNRYGKVLHIGKYAWLNDVVFPEPRCYVHDWIIYRRYETQIWGHKVLASTCPVTGLVTMSDVPGEEIVFGKILGEYVIHSYGPELHPDMLDTSKHKGR